jgi:hypothetical protein
VTPQLADFFAGARIPNGHPDPRNTDSATSPSAPGPHGPPR